MSDAPRIVKLCDLWQENQPRAPCISAAFMGDTQVLLFNDGKKRIRQNQMNK